MADKPLLKIIGKRRKEPDMALIASALIDLVVREEADTEAAKIAKEQPEMSAVSADGSEAV